MGDLTSTQKIREKAVDAAIRNGGMDTVPTAADLVRDADVIARFITDNEVPPKDPASDAVS
jgi:hypothetical protein